jgi:hypothetical protein
MPNTTARSTPNQDALRSHFEACQRALEPVFFMRCWFEGVHDAMVPRFGTTVLSATALIGLLLMWA